MKSRSLLALAILPALILPAAPVLVAPALAAPAEVVVTEAWVKASEYSDHVGGMTGAFMKITNKTKKAIYLVGGSSSIAQMVETHQVVGGMMSKKEGGIRIWPGKTVTLQPGGLHIMLMGLKKAILPGSKVDLTLKFTGAKNVVLKPMLAKISASGQETYTPAPMPSATK